MLEKLFEQFVPSVPSAKTQRVQPEAPNIKAVPRVPSVPPEKTEIEINNDRAEAESQAEAVITIYPRFVTCYTPNGQGLQVIVKDAGHEAFLLRMNPKPKTVTCHACNNFTPHHAHGKGSGSCTRHVMPSGVCHWSETQHTCNTFTPKGQPPC